MDAKNPKPIKIIALIALIVLLKIISNVLILDQYSGGIEKILATKGLEFTKVFPSTSMKCLVTAYFLIDILMAGLLSFCICKWSKRLESKTNNIVLSRHNELCKMEKCLPRATLFAVALFFLSDFTEDVTALIVFYTKCKGFPPLSTLSTIKLVLMFGTVALLLAQLVTFQLKKTGLKIYKDYGLPGNKIEEKEGLRTIYKLSLIHI